jgi:hypothetical protein
LILKSLGGSAVLEFRNFVLDTKYCVPPLRCDTKLQVIAINSAAPTVAYCFLLYFALMHIYFVV